jgi:hypothetical protein
MKAAIKRMVITCLKKDALQPRRQSHEFFKNIYLFMDAIFKKDFDLLLQ